MKTFIRILVIIALLLSGLLFNGMAMIYHSAELEVLTVVFHVLAVSCFGAAILLLIAWKAVLK